MDAEKVVIELEAKIAGYQRDLDRARAKTEQTFGAIGTAASKAEGRTRSSLTKAGDHFDGFAKRSRLASGIVAAAAGGFVARLATQIPAAIARAISSGLEYAASLGEQAAQLGVTTDALQEYRYAATQTGLSAEEMDQALSQLTRRIGEAADGTGAQAKAFKTLGIDIRDAKGEVLSAGDAIPRIAEALKGVHSPAERAALLMDLFGRSGQKLEPLLAQGAAGVNALRDASHRLGVVLSEDQIQKADETADKLSALKAVLSARIAGVVADNTDAILALANALLAIPNAVGTAIRSYQAFVAQAEILGARLSQLDPTTSARGKSAARVTELAATARLRELRDRQAGRETASDRAGKFRSRITPAKAPQGRSNFTGQTDIDFGLEAVAAQFAQTGKSAISGFSEVAVAAPALADSTESMRQYVDDLARLDADLVSVAAELIGTEEARLAARIAAIETQRQIDERAVQADKELSAVQREEKIARINATAEANRLIELRRDENRQREDAAEIQQSELQNQMDALRLQSSLTKDRQTRSDLEVELVRLAFEQQRLALEEIAASTTASDAQKQIARRRLELLGQMQAGAEQEARNGNQSPFQRYGEDIPQSAGQISDEFEKIAVGGLDHFSDGITDAITGTKSLGEVFKGVAQSIIRDLIAMTVKALLFKAISSAFGLGGGGGGGYTGVLGNLFGGGMSSGGSQPRASGGPVQAGRSYLVGERGAERFVPGQSGRIIPNNDRAARSGGGTTVIQHFTLDARYGITTPELLRHVNGVAAERARQAGTASFEASQRSIPQRLERLNKLGT